MSTPEEFPKCPNPECAGRELKEGIEVTGDADTGETPNYVLYCYRCDYVEYY